MPGAAAWARCTARLDLRLERPVALKLLSERLSDDEAFRERMLRESRLAASLDHPNVVPIYEAGEADGRLFIAMRYVDGTDLKALLAAGGRAGAGAGRRDRRAGRGRARRRARKGARPPRREAVQRPARPAGRPRARISRRLRADAERSDDAGPADGQLMGTVDYVAPEQIRGDQVDGRADVYALGCLLFETLTGTLPFTGASDVAVVYAHLEEEPPRGQRAASGAPAGDRRRPRPRHGEGPGRTASRPAASWWTRRGRRSGSSVPSRRRRRPLRSRRSVRPRSSPLSAAAVRTRDGSGAPGPAVTGGSIVRIDPATNRVSATLSGLGARREA